MWEAAGQEYPCTDSFPFRSSDVCQGSPAHRVPAKINFSVGSILPDERPSRSRRAAQFWHSGDAPPSSNPPSTSFLATVVHKQPTAESDSAVRIMLHRMRADAEPHGISNMLRQSGTFSKPKVPLLPHKTNPPPHQHDAEGVSRPCRVPRRPRYLPQESPTLQSVRQAPLQNHLLVTFSNLKSAPLPPCPGEEYYQLHTSAPSGHAGASLTLTSLRPLCSPLHELQTRIGLRPVQCTIWGPWIQCTYRVLSSVPVPCPPSPSRFGRCQSRALEISHQKHPNSTSLTRQYAVFAVSAKASVTSLARRRSPQCQPHPRVEQQWRHWGRRSGVFRRLTRSDDGISPVLCTCLHTQSHSACSHLVQQIPRIPTRPSNLPKGQLVKSHLRRTTM